MECGLDCFTPFLGVLNSCTYWCNNIIVKQIMQVLHVRKHNYALVVFNYLLGTIKGQTDRNHSKTHEHLNILVRRCSTHAVYYCIKTTTSQCALSMHVQQFIQFITICHPPSQNLHPSSPNVSVTHPHNKRGVQGHHVFPVWFCSWPRQITPLIL